MKILFYIGNLKKGGAERVVVNLSNNFAQNNDVIIVTTTKDSCEYDLSEKIKLVSLETEKINNKIKKNIKYIQRLTKIINTEKVDVAIAFLPEPSYRLLMIKNKINCPVIVSVRNDPKVEYKNILNKTLMKILFKKSDGFVFQTKEAQEYFPKKYQIKSTIIANPVDDNFYKVKYIGINSKEFVTVGRLTSQKNQQFLIETFEKIVKKYDDYKLLIYGDGELKHNLQEYLLKHNLTKNIKLCGNTNNVAEVIKDKYAFILPSLYEGMPNALMEAMAVGLPCISSDCPCGGPRELINNHENGILVEVNSESEMFSAIEQLILSKETCLNFSKKSTETMLKYKNDVISHKWSEFMEGVIKNAKDN